VLTSNRKVDECKHLTRNGGRSIAKLVSPPVNLSCERERATVTTPSQRRRRISVSDHTESASASAMEEGKMGAAKGAKLLVGGRWVAPIHGGTLPVVNPHRSVHLRTPFLPCRPPRPAPAAVTLPPPDATLDSALAVSFPCRIPHSS
jgi:hypothetical protein